MEQPSEGRRRRRRRRERQPSGGPDEERERAVSGHSGSSFVIGALSGGARQENRLDRTRKEESEKARERTRAKSPVTREMLLDALKVLTSQCNHM